MVWRLFKDGLFFWNIDVFLLFDSARGFRFSFLALPDYLEVFYHHQMFETLNHPFKERVESLGTDESREPRLGCKDSIRINPI